MRLAVCVSGYLVALLMGIPVLARAGAGERGLQAKPTEQADVPTEKAPKHLQNDRGAAIDHAWQVLAASLEDAKPQVRISAVTAMGTMLASKKSAGDIEKALTDPDRDVRLAAVDAAGTMATPLLIPALRKSLDDPAADISFAASEVLWQMGDHSGQNILIEVLTGERKSAPGFFSSGLHTANKDLHSPSTLATIGAEQGAYALLGPFGIGLDAARLMMKTSSSANSARVSALTLLSRDKSASTNREIITALKDKDYFVRASAARGLGEFHTKQTEDALLGAMDDSKPLVRCMAAAGYIRSTTEFKKKVARALPGVAHPMSDAAQKPTKSGAAREKVRKH